MEWFFGILIGIIVGGAALGYIGYLYGMKRRQQIAEAAIGSAEEEAKRIVNEACKSAEARKKEILLEGKDEIHRLRNESDKELRERRSEVQRQERRIQQKEESLDKKVEQFEKKEEQLAAKVKQQDAKLAEIEDLKRSQMALMERISGFTAEQAKAELLHILDDELTHEKVTRVLDMEQQVKDEAADKARDIISLAIQRCASDYVAEATVSVVVLPSDEMKGRIIGREGRNIHALETATGVDIIIDDTPEAITLSSHDPVKREVARVALERLITDGRIHPARIEEAVEKADRDVHNAARADGEKAVLEAGVIGLGHDVIELLGELRYRTSYGQNVLLHSLEVSHIAGIIASELGLDPTPAKRAGLLHDIGKARDRKTEGSHVALGVEFLRRHKEPEAIVHAIEAHHNDVEPQTVLAHIIQAADAISAARPGARRDNVENYIKRLQKLEEIGGSFPGVSSCYAIQAGREVRVMVKPDDVKDEGMVLIAREIAARIESELQYPGQIKVHLIRESRAVEYAK